MQFRLEKHRQANDGGCISDWCRKELISGGARAEFDAVLRILKKLPAAKWDRPEYAPLSGGISEIRFVADNRQYRPLGFFLPGEQQETYVILIGAYKKHGKGGGKFTPLDAKETAVKRRSDVLRDRAIIGILQ